jgi:hypothetical protein
MPARVDVPPGTVFGRFTIIEEAPRRGARRMMLCQCECGTRKIVDIAKLRSGHTRSCGCLHREVAAEITRTRPLGGRSADIAPGSVFGMLTVIGRGRNAKGVRAMLCRCECGTEKAVAAGSLRSGNTRSCGCLIGKKKATSDRLKEEAKREKAAREKAAETPLKRGEVPLRGKNARGRVALVDDGDWDLVMQYSWHVTDSPPESGRKRNAYAQTALPSAGDGKHGKLIRMHVLIMGQPYIDHANGNSLDNRRSNLRPATNGQNRANSEGYAASGFKGVYWKDRVGKYQAMIRVNGKGVSLGYFCDPAEGARAYDDAAREAFGEFARPNFHDEPTAAMEAQWQAEREAFAAEKRDARSARMSERWQEREPETRTCAICGGEYESSSMRPSLYCSRKCANRAAWPTEQLRRQRLREQAREGKLF